MFNKKINGALAILGNLKNFQDMNPDSPKTLADIAHEVNISLSYAEQLARVLSGNNLIAGVRGPGGGQKLEMNATGNTYEYCHISILEFTEMFYSSANINYVSKDFSEITLASIIG